MISLWRLQEAPGASQSLQARLLETWRDLEQRSCNTSEAKHSLRLKHRDGPGSHDQCGLTYLATALSCDGISYVSAFEAESYRQNHRGDRAIMKSMQIHENLGKSMNIYTNL